MDSESKKLNEEHTELLTEFLHREKEETLFSIPYAFELLAKKALGKGPVDDNNLLTALSVILLSKLIHGE